jgi:hypothetical protein
MKATSLNKEPISKLTSNFCPYELLRHFQLDLQQDEVILYSMQSYGWAGIVGYESLSRLYDYSYALNTIYNRHEQLHAGTGVCASLLALPASVLFHAVSYGRFLFFVSKIFNNYFV